MNLGGGAMEGASILWSPGLDQLWGETLVAAATLGQGLL